MTVFFLSPGFKAQFWKKKRSFKSRNLFTRPREQMQFTVSQFQCEVPILFHLCESAVNQRPVSGQFTAGTPHCMSVITKWWIRADIDSISKSPWCVKCQTLTIASVADGILGEISPPPYMTANMMDEIQDTWLLVTLKITSISLKKTVMDLGKA